MSEALKFNFYHKDTGVLHSKTVSTNLANVAQAEKFAAYNAPADHLPLQATMHLDATQHIFNIVTKQIEGIGPSPTPPTPLHVWNVELLNWVPGPKMIAADNAQRRLEQIMVRDHDMAIRAAVLGLTGAKKKLQDLHDEIETLHQTINDGTP